MVCVSCKSGKVTPKDLNELEIYANRLEGTFIRKIMIPHGFYYISHLECPTNRGKVL